jgi:ADP-ribosylglycohydrolase
MEIDQEIINILEKAKEDLERRLYFSEKRVDEIKIELYRVDAKLERISNGQTCINSFQTAKEILDEIPNK